MINLKIGEEVYLTQNPKNSYVIECEIMFGDSDGRDSITLGPFKEENIDYIEESVRVLEEMRKKHSDSYEDIKGFDIWFGGEILDHMDEDDPRFEFTEEWPNDPFTDYNNPGILDDYKIYYFNDQGIKFNVDVFLD